MANEELKSRILAYVSAYSDQKGFAPSYHDIQQATGVKSVSTVHDYVKRLEAEGRLDMKPKHPRALSTMRRVKMHANSTQRIRLELDDGGIVFVDFAVEKKRGGDMYFKLCGVLDASQLKGAVSSVVACTIEGT